jgi:hypothetical protein
MGHSGRNRRIALRFALYVKTMGFAPLPFAHADHKIYAIALQQQYEMLKLNLDSKIVAAARIAARAAIRRETLSIAAQDLVPPVPPTPPRRPRKTPPPGTNSRKITIKKSKCRLEAFFKEMGHLVPKCPRCRMRCGLPKKSWPTREMAEECRQRGPDPAKVRIYECPHQQGYWHVGHPQ